MPKHRNQRKNHQEKEHKHLERIERKLALIAPPKVENYVFTVMDVVKIKADLSPVANYVGRLAMSGNGYYTYSVGTSNATYAGTAQQDQLDRYFSMYKYWTPLAVRMHIQPYFFDYEANSASTGGRTLIHQPWQSIKDLEPDIGADISDFAAKGVKPFCVHDAKKAFQVYYPNLDRLALQKQQKNMFLCNGSWFAREQLRDPACITIRTVNPSTGVTEYGLAFIELQIRFSERLKPGTELRAQPQSLPVEVVQQPPPPVVTTTRDKPVSTYPPSTVG